MSSIPPSWPTSSSTTRGRCIGMTRFAAVCAMLGTVAYVTGFATPWWLQAPSLDATSGLWTYCMGANCTAIISTHVDDWLIACQSLAITALLTSLLTVGLTVAMAKSSRDSTSTNTRYGSIATSLFTVLTMAVLLLTYYLQRHVTYPGDQHSLSTSFFLVLAGCCVFLAVALILAVLSLALTTGWRRRSAS